MKYEWSQEDIIAGRIVCKNPGSTGFTASGSSAKWTFKLGFLPGNDTACNKVLISVSDGMVGPAYSKAAIAQYLNENNMMPMPHAWWLLVCEYLRDSYEGT